MNQVKDLFDFLPSGDTLSKSLLYFLGSAMVSLIIAPLVIKFLYKWNIRRVSKGDKVSSIDYQEGKIGTPIMGGIIVITSVLLITVLFNWERNFTWLPVGVFLLSAIVGGIDDILNLFGNPRKTPKEIGRMIKLIFVHKSIRKRILLLLNFPWHVFKRLAFLIGSKPNSGLLVHEKLILQGFIGFTVALWIYVKLGWTSIWLPYFTNIDFVYQLIDILPLVSFSEITGRLDMGILIIPFITLTIMTVTNAVNISDGMDGLSAGLLFIGFVSYAIIAYSFSQIVGTEGYRYITYLCTTVAGSLLAYLYFNVKPARIQFGDVGSLGLGTLLAVIAIILNREFTLLFIAGMFIYNGIISVFIQRISMKFFNVKVYKLIPLHYHYKKLGWSEEKIVMRFWIMGVFFAALGIWLSGL